LDEVLLSRIEDAGINASAPPQQRWLDGWLVRTSPGAAKRARCVLALAEGRLSLDVRLQLARAAYAESGLSMIFRITPFSRPVGLDLHLDGLGFARQDETRVMLSLQLSGQLSALPAPGLQWQRVNAVELAEIVGSMRGTPVAQRQAHAARLVAAPVPHQAWALREAAGGRVLACGQFAREGELVGLYDIHVCPSERRRGLGRSLCAHLLQQAAADGASTAYLQVDADNDGALRMYRALGFVDAYRYHYRQAP
jgi:ribosomal protein S18 acetylase RimI-like enzyme